MSYIQFLRNVAHTSPQDIAIIDCDHISYTYQQLIDKTDFWISEISNIVSPSMVVGVYGDFNIQTVSLFLSLIELKAVIVPLSIQNKDIDSKKEIAEIELFIDTTQEDDNFTFTGKRSDHPLFDTLKTLSHPGIIIFSSGSTGEPKAALHDFTYLLSKFQKPRAPYRSIVFLLFDHWGGINTLLHILSCGGTACFPKQRSAEYICRLIEQYSINLLPSTPTFLNLMLINQAYKNYDLTSLSLITYGTESMPEATLLRLNQEFPWVAFKQTYGLTELGVMRTVSKSNQSLWLKVGGEDYQTKVVDGRFYIRTKSSIIGYLNAPSPFDAEGWYNTGDQVEVDGEWIKFLGRESDIINVGGQKVFPAEVESTILSLPWVADCVAFGEKNPITGMNVSCKIVLSKKHDVPEKPQLEVKKWCKQKMESFKIPVRILIIEATEFNQRFKKNRDIKG